MLCLSSVGLKLCFITLGLMYSYLAEGVGRSDSSGAFRSLKRGFKHWASGRLSYLELNVHHPLFCHVRSKMTPSMKQGIYTMYILLGSESGFATIKAATCECAAGYVCVCVWCVCVCGVRVCVVHVCVCACVCTRVHVHTCICVSLFVSIFLSYIIPYFLPPSLSLSLSLSLPPSLPLSIGSQHPVHTYLVSFMLLSI